MPLAKDWRAFIESLNSNKVEYLIVGGVALAYHGAPRYTGGLDVWVRNSPEDARRLAAALEAFGFGGLGLKASDFVDSYQVIQLGRAPNRMDFLASLTGVSFEEDWAGKVAAELGGTPTNFIGREALIRNKKATGRAQDHADLKVLETNE